MKSTGTQPIRLDAPRAWRTYTGGAKLDLLHGKEKGEITQFPEEWIMSVVEARNAGREHIIGEGLSHLPEMENQTLRSLVASNPARYLGQAHADKWGAELGVLVKLIDSAERLTVQVHPDKDKARILFDSEFGKTECWHILDTSVIEGQSACIYIGFKPSIDPLRWKHLFEVQDIAGMLDCMHRIEVKTGDTILIHGGVPHAIGAGCFLAEIQEPTDYTIRIERKTPAGLPIADKMCHQGLGFDKMFDCFTYEGVTEEEAKKRWFIPAKTLTSEAHTTHRSLIGYDTCALFALEEICTSERITLACPPVFGGVYVLEGEGTLTCGNTQRTIEKAQQYFLPAHTQEITLQAKADHPLRILRFFGPQT